MKIAVIGANGKAVKLITAEAVSRNLDVTAIVREENQSLTPHVIQKDLFKLTYDDLKDFDVIIDAFGAWTPDTLHLHSESLVYLCDLLSGKPNRLLVVGGAGGLFVAPELTIKLTDTPDFPEAFLPLALAQGKSLDELRLSDDVQWTFVSPAADFVADGERTGSYQVGGEQLLLNHNGDSTISYADYAIGMIDEATKGNAIQKRISLVSK